MISIVTPSFGQANWLPLCMASAADQKGVCIEHIVQDGGTEGISDATLQSARHADDYKLRLYIERDAGMYDAINRGLKRATGEICAYLNCDEQYLSGSLPKVAAFFEARPQVDVLFGDVILVDEKGQPLSYRRTVLPSLNHVRFAHLNTGSCAMFFRRRLVERGFLFDTQWKAIGDAVWVRRLLEAKVQMEVIPEPLAVFTFTGQNLGATPLSAQELERLTKGARFSRIRKPAAILSHRFRKLLAGAYRPRNVDFAIYTLASPNARQRRYKAKVGFGWPKNGLS